MRTRAKRPTEAADFLQKSYREDPKGILDMWVAFGNSTDVTKKLEEFVKDWRAGFQYPICSLESDLSSSRNSARKFYPPSTSYQWTRSSGVRESTPPSVTNTVSSITAVPKSRMCAIGSKAKDMFFSSVTSGSPSDGSSKKDVAIAWWTNES